MTMPSLQITAVTGSQIAEHTDALAELRIAVFREWPYLYEGSTEYERKYLKRYAACPQSIVVLARDGNRIVGASTGLPLGQADADFQKPFETSDVPVDEVYYFGESVLLPEYRGQGTGHHFFELREQQARACGASVAAFCAIDRDPNDARRPASYRPLDAFWRKKGYIRHPEMSARFDWRELGQTVESSHTLSFWLKQL